MTLFLFRSVQTMHMKAHTHTHSHSIPVHRHACGHMPHTHTTRALTQRMHTQTQHTIIHHPHAHAQTRSCTTPNHTCSRRHAHTYAQNPHIPIHTHSTHSTNKYLNAPLDTEVRAVNKRDQSSCPHGAYIKSEEKGGFEENTSLGLEEQV